MSTDKFMQTSLANKSVVERIVDQITNAIINGEVKPGDKILTEPELCETFGVGRNPVREAIKILAAYGVLEIRRADGTYICQEYNYKMLYPILYGIILQKDSKQQIIELRKVIDVGIMHEAMKRMTSEDLQRLEAVIKDMEEEIQKENPSSGTIFDIDVRFHTVMTAVFSNHLLESIGYYVDKITRQSRVLAIEYILENGLQKEFLTLHKEMIEVLRKKDENQISSIIEKHYKYWEK